MKYIGGQINIVELSEGTLFRRGKWPKKFLVTGKDTQKKTNQKYCNCKLHLCANYTTWAQMASEPKTTLDYCYMIDFNF